MQNSYFEIILEFENFFSKAETWFAVPLVSVLACVLVYSHCFYEFVIHLHLIQLCFTN